MMNNINELPEGQMGLKLIAQIADQLSYRRTCDRRNCLLIVKKYQPIRDQQRQTINLQVETDIAFLEQVLQWYDRLEDMPIPKPILMQCKIALAEGFTNAVRHAHKSLPLSTPIDLEIQLFKNRLEMRIWDCGQTFDLMARINKDREKETTKKQGILSILLKNVAKVLGQGRERKYMAVDGDLI